MPQVFDKFQRIDLSKRGSASIFRSQSKRARRCRDGVAWAVVSFKVSALAPNRGEGPLGKRLAISSHIHSNIHSHLGHSPVTAMRLFGPW